MREHDLLSIKEFADFTGVNASALRYYDKIGLFHPLQRNENDFRYYSAMQTIVINFINVMSSLKVPLKDIGAVKQRRTPQRILDLLHHHELKLNEELQHIQQSYSIIHTYCKLIQEGLSADEHAVGVQQMDSLAIEQGPENDFASGSFYESFFVFLQHMKKLNVNMAFPAGGVYQNMKTFLDHTGKPGRFFAVTPAGRQARTAGRYITAYTRGYYGQLGDLPQRMQAHVLQQGLSLCGPVYELYLHDEISVAEPDQYLIQISVMVN